MKNIVSVKSFSEPPFCEKEILRYAGCREADKEITELMHECIQEVRTKLVYKVCSRETEVKINDGACDFGFFSVSSEKLAKNLSGCESALVFGATVGVEIDRLIARYGRLSPAKALMLQAVGAERIEALCDLFCDSFEMENGVKLRARFSPGYGDLPLSVQRDIFDVLDCTRKIGLSLSDSLLMSPSKSVTAFAGISDGNKPLENKCGGCDKADCVYRS